VEIARSKYRAEKVEVGRAAMRRLSYLRIIKFDSLAISMRVCITGHFHLVTWRSATLRKPVDDIPQDFVFLVMANT
jgi:hypothetical protein